MTYPNSMLRTSRNPSGILGLPPSRLPQAARVKIESPSVLAAAKKAAAEATEDTSTDPDSSARSDGAPKSEGSTSVATFPDDSHCTPNILK